MQRLFYFFLVLSTIMTVDITLRTRDSAAADCAVSTSNDKNNDRHKREKDFYQQRSFQKGQPVMRDVYDRALEQWRKVPRALPPYNRKTAGGTAAESFGLSSVTSLLGTVWTPIGPSPINEGSSQANGRVSSIAINPNNPMVIYQGSSGGGVWRTIDGGATWTPLTDQQSTLGTGEPSAIAIDPSDTNTIYVGTSGRFVLNISKGILKSTDGGASWVVLGSGFPADNVGNAYNLFAGQDINVIIVDPANSNMLYLAASNGLFRSTDGGRNWTQGANGGGDARSLVLDTTSPVGNRILNAGVSFSGVRQSTDGGQTWTQILSTATPAVAAALPANSGIGQVLVDLAPPASPANPAGIQVLYATMQGRCTVSGCGVSDPLGLFRSTDQGANWNEQTGTGIPTNTQGGFSFSMSVDPASPGDGSNDIIYLGAVGAAKSTNSGNNFAPVGPGIHADSHSTWVFFKQPTPTPSIVLTGNDGGIWRSTDGGATWSGTGGPAPTINAGGLQTALFYNMDVKKDATASVTEGSLQDNGTPRTTGSLTWTDTSGGDGFSIAFDSVNQNTAYMTSGFWSGCGGTATCSIMFQSTTSGSSWINLGVCAPWFSSVIPAPEQDCVTAVPGTHPIKVDPTDGNYVYYGGVLDLWQTTNGMGSSFRKISNGFGRPNSVDIARGNSNNVVVGFNGQVWVSTNAKAATVGPPSGVIFTNITRNLPAQNVTRVLFDPNDPTVIYATLTGFGSAANPSNVFRTTIGGSFWTDISPPVNVPVNAIALDGTPAPTTIYIGNDLGVMRSVDGGANWAVLDDVHLPNVPVTDLTINTQAGVLRAATFGRGAFDLAVPNGPVISVNAQNGLDFGNVCAGSVVRLTLQIFNVGTQDLLINSVQRLFGSGDFTILPNPSTPLTVSPNSEVDFTVQFRPTATSGTESAQIRISSNDPSAPYFDLMASGTIAVPNISVTGSTDFGNVCSGTQAEKAVSVCNVGACNLNVTSAAFNPACPDFTIINNPFPAAVSPDSCLNLTVRFTPNSPGPKTCTLVITSDDPNLPSITKQVTADTQASSIDVPPDLGFPATVIQSVGACQSLQPFPISNTGTCNLKITNISIGGVDGNDYSLSGLPSFPIILEPGHVAGEGNLNAVFKPAALDRDRLGSITVTYESDPITHATSNVTRSFCGEGVRTGARVLVRAGGVPLSMVEKIQLKRIGGNQNKDILDTADVAKDLPLQTVTPAAPCPSFQFHREYGTVSNPIQLTPGSYEVTVSAIVNGKRESKTVGFNVDTCDFNPTVIVDY